MNVIYTINNVKDAFTLLEELEEECRSRTDSSSEKFTRFISNERFPYGIWFRGEIDRGQSTNSRPLTPSVFRLNPKTKQPWDENTLLGMLPIRIPEINEVKSKLEKLCLMQHYNIPTRLLDWTESVLVALFFAVENDTDFRDSSLYVLNARKLNKETGFRNSGVNINDHESYGTNMRIDMAYQRHSLEWFEYIESNYGKFDWRRTEYLDIFERGNGYNKRIVQGLSTPIAVTAVRNNPRIIFQGGVFTLHGGKVLSNQIRNDLRDTCSHWLNYFWFQLIILY